MALQSPPLHSTSRRESPMDSGPLRRTVSGASVLGRPMQGSATVLPLLPESESRLTVGPHIKLKSVEISNCDTLWVDGAVEATMDLRVMQINERGTYTGKAEVDSAEIRGQFDGVLIVRETLVIHATGRVAGRIRYGRIVIEEGGQIAGDIEMGGTQLVFPATSAPAPAPKAVPAG